MLCFPLPTDDLSVIQDQKLSELGSLVNTSVYKHLCRWYFIYESVLLYFFKGFRQPPALPYRLQHSTIGRLGLNHRVRDENGCVPQAHNHQKCSYFGFLHRRCALRITTSSLSFFLDLPLWQINSNPTPTSSVSLERRWSSRTFRYGYLVTTSPQLSDLPSAAPSLRLGHRLRAFPTPMVWRAVCTRPGNVFTAAFWSAITSDSSFM